MVTNSLPGIIDTPTLKYTDPFLRAKKIYFLNPASSNKVMFLLTSNLLSFPSESAHFILSSPHLYSFASPPTILYISTFLAFRVFPQFPRTWLAPPPPQADKNPIPRITR